MASQEVENNPELQRVLWACLTYWNTEDCAREERMVCFSWVVDPYKTRFGTAFHKSRLEYLARLGWLEKTYSVRGGNRRYYRIGDPERVSGLLTKCSLN